MDSQWAYWNDDDFGYYGGGNNGGYYGGFNDPDDDWGYRSKSPEKTKNATPAQDDIYKRKSAAESDPNLMKEDQLEKLDNSVKKKNYSKDDLMQISLDDLDINETIQ